MKVSFNTSPILNNQTTNSAKNCRPQATQTSFTGLSQIYDTFCHGVGKHFCRHIFDNKFIDRIAHTIRNSENAVKHFLAVGSVITSGMYMRQTLTNKKMDKDRRQTLAMNQLFTLILSTAGAYTLDSKLKNWWNKKHEQFMKLSENGKAAWIGMQERNEKIKNENAQINKDITAKVLSGEIKSDLQVNSREELNKIAKKFIKTDSNGYFAEKLADIGIQVPDTKDWKTLAKRVEDVIAEGSQSRNTEILKRIQAEDYVRKLIEPTLNIDQYLERYGKNNVFTDLEKLKIQSKGFGALRPILVFGFIYRFLVPLAVVKPTNYLCEKYLANKKAKEAAKQNSVQA